MKMKFKPGDTITWEIKKKSKLTTLILLTLIGLFIYWFSIGFKDKNYPILPCQTVYEEVPQIIVIDKSDTVVIRKYDNIGLPTSRKWLTSNEWKGKHLKDSCSKMKKSFSNWKENHKRTFLKEWKTCAIEEGKVSGIPAGIIVAQAMLESNWGMSRLAITANNFFGHKYKNKRSGSFVIAKDDSPRDKFTVYKSRWWSVRKHSNILNGRYVKRLKGKSIEHWLEALCGGTTTEESQDFVTKGGKVYATSCMTEPCYAQKLLKIILDYKLYNQEII